MQIGLREGDRAAGAGARVDAFLDIHAKILFAFVFFRSHELDAHFIGAARNRFFKLEIAGFRDGRVPELLEDGRELYRLFPQGQDVEKEVDVFRSACVIDHEFHGLGAGDDKIIRCRAESMEKFQKVGALRFGNHAAFHLGAIALSRR
jgi:hypothetical protein